MGRTAPFADQSVEPDADARVDVPGHGPERDRTPHTIEAHARSDGRADLPRRAIDGRAGR